MVFLATHQLQYLPFASKILLLKHVSAIAEQLSTILLQKVEILKLFRGIFSCSNSFSNSQK